MPAGFDSGKGQTAILSGLKKTNAMKLSECKKEWNTNEWKMVDRAILRHFSGKSLLNHRGEVVKFPVYFSGVEDILGLPYTSTSQCAMFGTDGNVQIFSKENPDFHYSHVVMNEENEVFAVLQDNEENEKFIKI